MPLLKQFLKKDSVSTTLRSCGAKFKFFWQEKTVRLATRIFLAILLFSLAFLILVFKNLPPWVPLFYSLPWGEEQLAKSDFLLILPLCSFLFGILNFSLAIFSFEHQSLASKILVWTNVLLAFLLTLTLVKIVFLIS